MGDRVSALLSGGRPAGGADARAAADASAGADVEFVDVVFADALTSMSKMLADMQVILCGAAALVYGSDIEVYCAKGVVGPTLASLPYVIRGYQCWLTFDRKGDQRQLVNLGKYVSSLPVIWISALKHDLAAPGGVEQDEHDRLLEVLWVYVVVINTVYSALWDIFMDWGLGRPRAPQGQRQWLFLRPRLWYRAPLLYYGIIVINAGLRACWSLKLSSHLQTQVSGVGFVFIFEVLEVLRRWMWIYLRVEWECISKGVEA